MLKSQVKRLISCENKLFAEGIFTYKLNQMDKLITNKFYIKIRKIDTMSKLKIYTDNNLVYWYIFPREIVHFDIGFV